MANYSKLQYDIDTMLREANNRLIELKKVYKNHGKTSKRANEAREEYEAIKNELKKVYGIDHH